MLYGFQAFLQGTVDWGCSLYIQFPNLPQGDCQLGCSLFIQFRNLSAGDCRSEVQPVFTVSEPSSRRYSLFIRFWKLPQGTCPLAACLYSFRTFLPGTVGQRCSLVIHFLNLPPGTVRIHNANFIYSRKSNLPSGNCPWCSQCMRFPNLPSGDCQLGV